MRLWVFGWRFEDETGSVSGRSEEADRRGSRTGRVEGGPTGGSLCLGSVVGVEV